MARRVLIDSSPPTVEAAAADSLSMATRRVNGDGDLHGPHRCSKVGEAVGGAAAVCCCCPCAVMHLLFLAVYRVPTGLCKKAWRKKKSLQRRHLLKKRKRDSASAPQPSFHTGPRPIGLGFHDDDDDDEETTSDGDDVIGIDSLDMEMLEHLYRGFWTSPSQKED